MNQELITRNLVESEYPIWDEFVQESPQGTIFHMSRWITTSASAKGTAFELIGVFDGDTIVGGCPIFYRKKFGFLEIIYSAEQLSWNTGIMLPKRNSQKVRANLVREHAIIDAIREYIDDKHFTYVLLSNNIYMKDIRPFTWHYWQSSVSYTYILDLPFTLSGMSSGVKREIKKAEGMGIVIKKHFDFEIFWDMMVDTYKRQNTTPSETKEYVRALVNMVIENQFGEMWVAETPEGNIISARIVLYDKTMMHLWMGFTKTEYQNTGVRTLFNIVIFHEAELKGIKCINMMSANLPFLTNFVAGFNPKLMPQYNVHKACIPYVSMIPSKIKYYK